MSEQNLVDFLRMTAARADVLASLKTKSKADVIAAAESFGLPFTETEFDGLVWDLEVHLAEKRGERLDPHFPLWETLWGRHYLEFLVSDLMPSLDEADFDQVMAARAPGRP